MQKGLGDNSKSQIAGEDSLRGAFAALRRQASLRIPNGVERHFGPSTPVDCVNMDRQMP